MYTIRCELSIKSKNLEWNILFKVAKAETLAEACDMARTVADDLNKTYSPVTSQVRKVNITINQE